MTNPFLVGTDWLYENLGRPDLSIIDSSWYLPAMGRDPRQEFDRQHIPGAVFFDLDDVVAPDAHLPHTLASPEVFAQKMGTLGVSERDTIVVYDGIGLFSAPRVWWNFRIMGAAKVVILDGGLPKWLEDRLPVEAGTAPINPKQFAAVLNEPAIADFEMMLATVADRSSQIADARPTARFTGEAAEPRPGMRSGHMPGATSLPIDSLQRDGRLLSAQELKRVFDDAGIDLNQPVITTCGSGVTAAAIVLALETVGHRDHRLYDGSWSQWGSRDDTPVETGNGNSPGVYSSAANEAKPRVQPGVHGKTDTDRMR